MNGQYIEPRTVQSLEVFKTNEQLFKLIQVVNDSKLASSFVPPSFTNRQENWNSIEYYLYNLSVKKEEPIANTMYIIKQFASDCINGKGRNILNTEYDYTYECNFKKCDYKCLPINETRYDPNDFTNYMNNQKNINNTIPILKALFAVNSNIDIQSLITIIMEKLNIDKLATIFAVSDLLISKFTVTDKYGSLKYLVYSNGFLILSNKYYNDDDIYYIENQTVLNPINIFDLSERLEEKYKQYEDLYNNIDFSNITVEQRLQDSTPLKYFYTLKIQIINRKRTTVVSVKEEILDVNILPIIDNENLYSNFIYRFYTADGPIRFRIRGTQEWNTTTDEDNNIYKEYWYPIRRELVKTIFDLISFYRASYPIMQTIDNKDNFSAQSVYVEGNSYVDNNGIQRQILNKNKIVVYGILTPNGVFNLCYIKDQSTTNLKSLITGKLCNATTVSDLEEICKLLDIACVGERKDKCNTIYEKLNSQNLVLNLSYK